MNCAYITNAVTKSIKNSCQFKTKKRTKKVLFLVHHYTSPCLCVLLAALLLLFLNDKINIKMHAHTHDKNFSFFIFFFLFLSICENYFTIVVVLSIFSLFHTPCVCVWLKGSSRFISLGLNADLKNTLTSSFAYC